jgi:hypothetical protein
MKYNSRNINKDNLTSKCNRQGRRQTQQTNKMPT